MLLNWSSRFSRDLKRLARRSPELREKITKTLNLLEENPFHPSLHTHKLKGNLSGVWSCSVDYDYRILFEFVIDPESQENSILLLALGSHDVVY